MSRRLSIQMKNPNQKKPKSKVKFPDELVFLDSVKDNDIDNVRYMLRRASLQIDLNKINDTGLTPLHQAVLDNLTEVVALLLENKANVNVLDEDGWTPLHAACSMGHEEVAKFLLENGANPHTLSKEGERPLDVIEQNNFPLISLLLNYMREYPSDDNEDQLSDEDILKCSRRDRKSSPIPTDPSLLTEFCETNLAKILKNAKANVDDIFVEIKKTFQDDKFLKSKEFVSYLTMAIIDSCMSHQYHNDSKLNTEILTKKLPVLARYIGNSNDLELECLYAIQKLDFKYKHPAGLFRNIFDTFYYCSSIKKDTFKQWKKNENPYFDEKDHKYSLNLLIDFFNF